MSQKNYLVTGAGRGIGRGLTRLLLSKGHRVFLVDSNTTELEHMSSQLKKWFPPPPPPPPPPSSSSSQTVKPQTQYQIHHADLSSESAITTISETASTFFDGHLDVLINNAAYTAAAGSTTSLNSPDFPSLWTQAVSINLTAPVLLSRACLPMLRRSHTPSSSSSTTKETPKPGNIIHISSTRAHQSEPNSEAYAATKSGLVGLTHSMASSLSNERIRVNAILPGWINVSNECKEADEQGTKWEDGLSEEDMRWHWTGRVGKVDDVLRAVEYLDGAEFVTGSEVVVDGGVSRRMVYPE